ncbi:alpha-(1-_6)-mannopyranosyltransferase A [Corynebacterium amycolatum]|uniref:alpha-(1->6)-mannopyranosyltransferase A n=1 Tax=Corynebacterium amycolatum TaxID=43765 RepID=UPI00234D142C|nr:alpha-(1->6)-mannopyranosyltransferase A [Corynebacterium amycolatum]MDC7116747.1 alpha-(1->6)-mannopyranosyltransferase A [Corynebacterium amycolatum]
MNLSRSAQLGVYGGILIALGSYGSGANRYRGGLVHALGHDWITYGHGQIFCEIVIWVGIALLLISWLRIGRELLFSKGTIRDIVAGSAHDGDAADAAVPANAGGDESTLRRFNSILMAWAIPLALAAPLFSRDVYSYLMQGAMVRDGFDPYTEGAAANPGPMLLEVSADWRNTTTPYGPLHLGIGEVITRIVGDNITVGVILYRIVCLLGFAAIVWSIPRIARELGANPAFAQWLGVLNPLVLLHLIAGMHNEALMVGLVSLALVAALHMEHMRGGLVAAVLIGIGVALKATAVLALPFVVWIVLTRREPIATVQEMLRKIPAIAGVGIVLVAVCVGTLAVVTWLTGSSWGWISEISGNTKVINPLAAPSAVAGVISGVMAWFNDDIGFNVIVSHTRVVSSIIMLVGLVISWFYFRATPRNNVAGMIAAYVVACVFNAVALPWYYASLLTPMGTIRPPRWVVQGTVLFTFILSLSFAGGGNHRFYDVPWMVIITVLGWLAVGWLTTGKFSWKYPWRDDKTAADTDSTVAPLSRSTEVA